MRLKVIACDVLNRELSYLSALSSSYVDITFLHQGLHNTPDKLRQALQEEVDKANEGFPYNYYNTAPSYDYIILGYGLCSNGIAGVVSKSVPMIIPRGHDCITLLLGSKEIYTNEFNQNPGTYWFSKGWVERGWQPSETKFNVIYKEYEEKYGEDNAEYLMEAEQQWMKDYKNVGCIAWNEFGANEELINFTKESAKFFNWSYTQITGDSSLMARILNGVFDENEVLIVPPGRSAKQSFDNNVIDLND
jgi:hypothetical protein